MVYLQSYNLYKLIPMKSALKRKAEFAKWENTNYLQMIATVNLIHKLYPPAVFFLFKDNQGRRGNNNTI